MSIIGNHADGGSATRDSPFVHGGGDRDGERDLALDESESPRAAWRLIRSLAMNKVFWFRETLDSVTARHVTQDSHYFLRRRNASSRISSSRFILSCSTFCSFSFSARLSALSAICATTRVTKKKTSGKKVLHRETYIVC